jgi:hypothetical protein
MANLADLYPSNYVKAVDLKGKEALVTIRAVIVEKVGDDIRPVVYFNGTEKGLVCNKTNAYAIGTAYGENTDFWIGKQIILFPAYTDYQGKQVLALRVRIPTAQHQPGAPGHQNTLGAAHGFAGPQPGQGVAQPQGGHLGVGFGETGQISTGGQRRDPAQDLEDDEIPF